MTLLVSLCWLDEPGRVERNVKWLDYNKTIQKELGFDKIILIDNNSSLENLQKLDGTVYDPQGNLIINGNKEIVINTFNEHLPRTATLEYPYCWRGLDFITILIKNYNPDKIIFMDTDFYVLTPKFADYIKNLNSGWVSVYCKRHNFPEAAFQVLCKDSYNLLLNFPIPSYDYYNGKTMETLLPFTHINKTNFKGDRYGELNLEQTPDMDFYAQHNINGNAKDLIWNMK